MILALAGLVVLIVVATSRLEPEYREPLAARPAIGPEERIGSWEPVFVGVEVCRASAVRPRPMQIRVVRVDGREAV